MKLITDGSSTIGVKSAYCVTDETGKVLSVEESYAPDDKTNNEEEYRGVIKALSFCNPGDVVCSDSLLVVNQINGRYKVKVEHLKPLCQRAKELLKEKGVIVTWIRREENLAGKIFE